MPVLAIFIDGLNEGKAVPYYTDEMSRMFNVYTYAPWNLLTMAIERTPLVNLARAVRERRRPTPVPDPSWVRDEWLRNRRTIQALSREFGFSTYFFLQPVPGYRNGFAHHKLMTEDGARMFSDLIPVPHARPGVLGVVRIAERMVNVVDASVRLRLPPWRRGKQPRIVVVAEGEKIAAFVADRVCDVVRYADRNLDNGVLRGTGRARTLVHFDQIMKESDFAEIWTVIP